MTPDEEKLLIELEALLNSKSFKDCRGWNEWRSIIYTARIEEWIKEIRTRITPTPPRCEHSLAGWICCVDGEMCDNHSPSNKCYHELKKKVGN
jgi:hypothetical protein